jgi:hypothetical protein
MRAVAMVIGYERLRQRERGAACQPTTAWGPTSICRRILTVADRIEHAVSRPHEENEARCQGDCAIMGNLA